MWSAAAIGATIYLSPHHSLRAQVAIGVGLFLAGVAWSAVTIFGALWLTAPVRQRDEVRDELAKAGQRAKFPRGRIEVENLYFDTNSGERLLLFSVRVTNREQAQRMNLELDFFLRLFGEITRLNPNLKPIDMKMMLVTRGQKVPPRPIIIEPQDSPPEFTYVVNWDQHNTGLVFDEDGHGFRPESDDDTLFLAVFDLQTGGRIEIPIPGVWES